MNGPVSQPVCRPAVWEQGLAFVQFKLLFRGASPFTPDRPAQKSRRGRHAAVGEEKPRLPKGVAQAVTRDRLWQTRRDWARSQ